MAGKNLSFSKVVSTPTTNAWSQAYSAGTLFAAISLQSDIIPQDDENLGVLGKDLISTLESEFFPLEVKDLENIKTAINTTFSKVKDEVKLSFVVCYLNDNILYLYAAGGAKAILKREEKIGTVIDSEDSRDIKVASGYVQDKDFIVLETAPFLKTVASPTLASALDRKTPEDISEDLAPQVHEKSEGGASAVILNYNEQATGVAGADEETTVSETTPPVATPQTSESEAEPNAQAEDETRETPSSEEINKSEDEISNLSEDSMPTQPMEQKLDTGVEKKEEEGLQEQSSPFLTDQKSRKRLPKFSFTKLRGLPRRRLIILAGIILILIVLIIGIFLFLNRGDSGTQARFDEIYNQARASYEEGLSLRDLNESLAQENFLEAQRLLEQNIDTFPQGSEEDNRIEELLNQVNSELGNAANESSTTATQVDRSQSQLLSYALDNPDSEFFTQNDDFVYFINDDGVTRIDKGNDLEESVIDNSWEEAGGIGLFGANVYVLDRADNILKFVPSGNEYSQSNYITGDVPDLQDSRDMTIDGSIYVLFANGDITKFTRGIEDDFSLSGLTSPLSNPTKIWTDEDAQNIYILDNGNSRIVVLDKEGEFTRAYSADIIAEAREFDIQENDNEIFVLSGSSIYSIDTQQ